MTVAQALSQAAALGIDRLDAQLLLLQALGMAQDQRAWLVTHDRDLLAAGVADRFEASCERRGGGEPLAYIVGSKEFFGLSLRVDKRVLVPRPDTETLVDWALEVLASSPAPSVLDLGTGSGAIALAIQARRPDARVHAVDCSPEALAVAQLNAERLDLPIQLTQADWLDGAGRHHLVVSNPPYIPQGDAHLPALAHEPLMALAAGPDGLSDLRQIVSKAPAHLLPGGWLLLEHGWDQARPVRELLAQAGFSAVQGRCDLAGHERCSGGQWLERR